jgi:DNA-binding MarR family transcriptional regulator
MTDLAQQLKVARTRLSYTISRMTDEGLVHREDSPGDKRGQFAVLTDAGLTALTRAAPGHVALVRAADFQERLVHGDRADRLLDLTLARLKEAGLVQERGTQPAGDLPQGQVSRGWHGPCPATSPTAAPLIVARFTENQCQPCPARTQCTTSRDGARAEQHPRGWPARYAVRSGVEGPFTSSPTDTACAVAATEVSPSPTCSMSSRRSP